MRVHSRSSQDVTWGCHLAHKHQISLRMVPSSSLGPTPVALGTRECCPSQAQRKLPPPNVTRFEAGPRCRIPELPVKQSDFSSVPVPPCSSSDVSAVTAPHGESQGGVFKLPKPAPTAWWIRDFPGWEELLEKKKPEENTASLPPQKKPQTRRKHKFSPQKYSREGENPARMSQNGFNPPRGKSPHGILQPFGTGGTNPNPAAGDLWLPLSKVLLCPGPAGIISPQAGALKSLGYDRFRGKVGREDNSHLLSPLTHVPATTKTSLEAPHSGQQSPGKIYY